MFIGCPAGGENSRGWNEMRFVVGARLSQPKYEAVSRFEAANRKIP